MNSKIHKRQKRKMHIRKTLSGTADRPRLTVYRSNKHIYAQLIDDVNKVTLASSSDVKLESGTPIEKAGKVGEEIGKTAIKNKIDAIVFDRNGYKFHGRVKALAQAARDAGLKF